MITLSNEIRPSAEAIAALYASAKLYRPVNDLDRIRRIYDGSPLIVTAWDDRSLVGILRGWTDGAFDGYVCDLAVDPRSQKTGIGKKLLDYVIAINPEIQWVLRASRVAKDYYEHVGWQKVENGWLWPRDEAWRAGATAMIDGKPQP